MDGVVEATARGGPWRVPSLLTVYRGRPGALLWALGDEAAAPQGLLPLGAVGSVH